MDSVKSVRIDVSEVFLIQGNIASLLVTPEGSVVGVVGTEFYGGINEADGPLVARRDQSVRGWKSLHVTLT